MAKIWRRSLLSLAVLWAAALPARAGLIEVSSTADDKVPKAGQCTLRVALQAALEDKNLGGCINAGGPDEIRFIGAAAA